MILSLIAIAMMGAVGYIWSARGFFSALLNLGVVIAAGAIAFAVWEPTALWLMGTSDGRMVQDIVWGLSLGVPFALAVVVLSIIVNLTVRANLTLNAAANWVGGIICGVLAGVIVSGFAVMSLSMTRISEDAMGAQQIDFDNQGSPVRSGALWLPVDRWTAGFYGYTSQRSFATSRPLAVIRPHVTDEPGLLRLADTESPMRYSLRPDDVELKGRYTVGAVGQPNSADELLGDVKKPKLLDGTSVSQGYIEAFILDFKPGAKEKSGQVIVSAGSATLVLQADEEPTETLTLQPNAVVSQSKGDNQGIGRWRLDSKDVYIGSIAAQSSATMALEFLVPAGPNQYQWKPIALYVRGVRFDLLNEDGAPIMAAKNYPTGAEREAGLDNGSVLSGGVGTTGPAIEGRGREYKVNVNANDSPIRATNSYPGNIRLDTGQISGVSFSKGNQLLEAADMRLLAKDLASIGIDRSLISDGFAPGDGTSLISVDVSVNSPFSLLDPEAASATGAPALIDTLGQRYEAIGFVYKDNKEIRIRFTPGRPIANLNEPGLSISRSRDDQTLHLVFRVSQNVKIARFVIGSKPLFELNAPVEVAPQVSK